MTVFADNPIAMMLWTPEGIVRPHFSNQAERAFSKAILAAGESITAINAAVAAQPLPAPARATMLTHFCKDHHHGFFPLGGRGASFA